MGKVDTNQFSLGVQLKARNVYIRKWQKHFLLSIHENAFTTDVYFYGNAECGNIFHTQKVTIHGCDKSYTTRACIWCEKTSDLILTSDSTKPSLTNPTVTTVEKNGFSQQLSTQDETTPEGSPSTPDETTLERSPSTYTPDGTTLEEVSPDETTTQSRTIRTKTNQDLKTIFIIVGSAVGGICLILIGVFVYRGKYFLVILGTIILHHVMLKAQQLRQLHRQHAQLRQQHVQQQRPQPRQQQQAQPRQQQQAQPRQQHHYNLRPRR